MAKNATSGALAKANKLNWSLVKAAFLATHHGSPIRFAREHGLNTQTIAKRSSVEGWVAEWDRLQAEIVERARQAVMEDKLRDVQRWNTQLLDFAQDIYDDLREERQRTLVGATGRSNASALTKRRWAAATRELQAVIRTELGLPKEITAHEVIPGLRSGAVATELKITVVGAPPMDDVPDPDE